MSDKETKKDYSGMIALIAMTLVGLLLLVFGFLELTAMEEPAMGVLSCGIGFLVLILCIAVVIMMIRQRKQGITPESKLRWESGVLTDKVIKKDLYAHRKTVTVGYFVLTGVLAFIAVLFAFFTEEISTETLLFAVLSFVTLFKGIQTLVNRNKDLKYRVESDKVLGGEVKFSSNRTTHAPDRTAVLNLEKYGEYMIDPMQIHAYYPPEALAKMIEPGEEVFVVYSVKTNKLLHIYLKRFWERAAD